MFQLAAADSNRPTNCMRFSATRSQTFHSMTSSAITKSGSSSRLSHRVINNTNNSDDIIDDANTAPTSSVAVCGAVPSTSSNISCEKTPPSSNSQSIVATSNGANGETALKENVRDVSGVSNNEGISSVSSNSVINLNIISSINLESDFIEAVIEDYKNY